MRTKQLLLTDLHLGVKNGSMTWLKYQKRFLDYLLTLDGFDEVICLGDVFDARIGVQTHIATFAREWFSKWDKPVTIIAGNHDYYSPDTDKYCALDNILSGISNVTIVSHEIVERDKQVFIPWYDQEKYGISELSEKYKGNIIFTHADITQSTLYTPTFSGHIHYPVIESMRNRYSLGSCFPLTFSDCDPRFAYILESEDGKVINLTPIENKISIQFHRYYEWPNDLDNIDTKDYIELYIKPTDIPTNGSSIMDKWKSKFSNLTIYKVSENINDTEGIDMSRNISDIVFEMIPAEYKKEFQKIISEID